MGLSINSSIGNDGVLSESFEEYFKNICDFRKNKKKSLPQKISAGKLVIDFSF
jgi:hypothetical protein